MNDLSEAIRTELHTIVAQAPDPVSVEAIRHRSAADSSPQPEPAKPSRHRGRFVFAGVLAVGVVMAVAVVSGRVPWLGTAALSPEEIAAATSRPADEPPFKEDVDWPHYLVSLDNGWELVLTEELRPGFLDTDAFHHGRSLTTQTFATDDSGRLHLEIIEADGLSQDENKGSVADHPYILGLVPPRDPPATPGFNATWQWGTADVHVRASGITESDGRELLEDLEAREGDPLRGFEPGEADLELVSERIDGSADDVPNPAVVRAWYGTETETEDGVQTETKLMLTAMAPDGQPPDLRSVAAIGGGGSIEEIAGREVLLDTASEFIGWTTAAWYSDGGELLSVSINDLPDDDGDLSGLATIIEAVEPADQAAWDAAVADLSDRIADNPVAAEAMIGDVKVIAREASIDLNDQPMSHLCTIPAGQPETCRANLALRDGHGVTTPIGTLPFGDRSYGSAVISTVIDGVWWLAAFEEAAWEGMLSNDLTVTTEAGDIRMASSADRRFYVAALPSSATHAELSGIGQDYAFAERWRPSSAP